MEVGLFSIPTVPPTSWSLRTSFSLDSNHSASALVAHTVFHLASNCRMLARRGPFFFQRFRAPADAREVGGADNSAPSGLKQICAQSRLQARCSRSERFQKNQRVSSPDRICKLVAVSAARKPKFPSVEGWTAQADGVVPGTSSFRLLVARFEKIGTTKVPDCVR